MERTLALIKPDVIHRAEEIEDDILKSGFTILQVGSDGTSFLSLHNFNFVPAVNGCLVLQVIKKISLRIKNKEIMLVSKTACLHNVHKHSFLFRNF